MTLAKVMRFLASWCVVAVVVNAWTFPDKITVATPDPVGAQLFVEKHFGFLRRVLDFDGGTVGCGNVKWNTLCQNEQEINPPFGGDFSWEWNMHFVNTPKHPQGPMTLAAAAEHTHAEVTAAMRRGAWSEWMVQRTGYLTRDLSPVVTSLLDDGVPFLLTYRDDDDGHGDKAAEGGRSRGGNGTGTAGDGSVGGGSTRRKARRRQLRRRTSDAQQGGSRTSLGKGTRRSARQGSPPLTSTTSTGAAAATAAVAAVAPTSPPPRRLSPSSTSSPDLVSSSSSSSSTKKELARFWSHFEVSVGINQKLRQPAPARLWTLFVALPVGVVWEFTSEVLDPAVARRAGGGTAVRRPCDDVPLRRTPRLYPPGHPALAHLYDSDMAAPGAVGAHGSHAKKKKQQKTAAKEQKDGGGGAAAAWPPSQPNPTATISRHHTMASLDPVAEAHEFKALWGLALGPHQVPEQLHVEARANGQCAVVLSANGQTEARFERIEAARPAGTKDGTDSEGGHYSVADARQYFQKLHAQSMANRGYNSHMDHHLGLFLGGSPHAPQAIASFVEGLVKDGRAYLGQGRNHFESVFTVTRTSGHVFQFLWINSLLKQRDSNVDHPIKGCKSGKWSSIMDYEKLVHAGQNSTQIRAHFNPSGISPLEKKHFDLKAEMIKAGVDLTPDSLKSGGAKLVTPAFDLCYEGSKAEADWSIFECHTHIGPCCGDGKCEISRGENTLHCPRDCAAR